MLCGRSGLVVELVGLMLLLVFAAGVTALGLRRRATTAAVLVALAGTVMVAVKLASAAPYLAALVSFDELPDDVLHALARTRAPRTASPMPAGRCQRTHRRLPSSRDQPSFGGVRSKKSPQPVRITMKALVAQEGSHCVPTGSDPPAIPRRNR